MKKYLCTLLFVLSFPSFAGITVNATRVIYDGAKKESPLTVTNGKDSTVYLVRTWIEPDNKGGTVPFIITPPLFRIDPGQENIMRISLMSDTLPQDKESLYWLNVLSIPPATDKKNALQFSVNSKMKLIYRPAALVGKEAASAYKQIQFAHSGDKLTVTNPTPYYINLFSVSVNNVPVKDVRMIPPRSNVTLDASQGNSISWKAINDAGGITSEENKKI